MCSSTTRTSSIPSNGIGVPKFLLFKQRVYLSLIVLLSLFSSSSIFAQRTIGDAWTLNRGDVTTGLVAVDECAEGTTPSYGTATADGVTSDWNLTNDFFADMYEAGNPTKDLLSKAYLRYDCETNTLCVLVVMESGQPADQSAADSWMKVYDIANSTQVDGNSSAFAWLPNQGGWEGCFQLAEASYAEVEIHVNTNGRTSSTGKKAQGYKPLCIMCPDCPPAGQSCDDGDASTENDMTDGECGCAGTPCPDAGQTCDDGDASTENDMTDGECGCAGTPCPDAGQTCDDGDASTEHDMTDGECGCVGTPCTAEGKDCDDYDCNTEDYYDTSICDCVNEPIPTPSCNDGDECTTDYYDAANCECVNEPVDDLSCGEGTIDCEGQTDASYDPEADTYTLYADGCWHDCLSPDRDVHFYQELCGDGELVAHIASLSGQGYGGIVMREGLDPVARRAGAMTKLHTRTIRKEYRAEYGAPVHQMPKTRRNVEWFKMVRLGDKIKVYTSEEGNSWRLLYQIILPNLAECLDAGMMAYTINGSSDVTVVFDNVALTPAGDFFVDNNTGADFEYEEALLPLADNITPNNASQLGRVQLSDNYQVNQKLAVYPNPANQQVFVNIPAIEEGQTGILSLYNNLGQEVFRKKVDAEVTRTESISLNELGAGVYLFKLQVKGKADLTQRLIIGKN